MALMLAGLKGINTENLGSAARLDGVGCFASYFEDHHSMMKIHIFNLPPSCCHWA